jgi:hypothetical protein
VGVADIMEPDLWQAGSPHLPLELLAEQLGMDR